MKIGPIQTPRLLLREVEPADAKPISNILSDPEVTRHLPLVKSPFSLRDARKKVDFYQSTAKRNPRWTYGLGITTKEQDRFIGLVDLNTYEGGNGDVSYWLDQNQWRQGIMTEAVSKVMEFAFEELELARLHLAALWTNKSSTGLATKLGFLPKGVVKPKWAETLVSEYVFPYRNWRQVG